MVNIKNLRDLPNIRHQIVDYFKSYIPTKANVWNLSKLVLNHPVKTTAVLTYTYVINQLPETPYFKEAALGLITASVAYTLAQKTKNYFAKKEQTVHKDEISSEEQKYCLNMVSTFNKFQNVDQFQNSCVGIILVLPIRYIEDLLKISEKSSSNFIMFLQKNDIKLEDVYAIWQANPNFSETDYKARCETFDKIYEPKKREIDPSIFDSKKKNPPGKTGQEKPPPAENYLQEPSLYPA